MTVNPRNYSTRDEMDHWLATDAEREATETARHERTAAIDAANAALMAEAERDRPKTSTFDWLSLKSIDAHPDVAQAITARKEARAQFDTAQANIEQAHADLESAEAAAARGFRDEAILTNARTAIERAESDLRIAAQVVKQAEADLDHRRRRVRADASVNLHARHREVLVAFDAALATASEHSNRVAALENASRRLLLRPYESAARPVGRPLPTAAWRDKFDPQKGFFRFWRKFHGLGA